MQPSEKKVEEHKLVLEGLVQHYKLVAENDKSRTLVELLDHLEFNQARLDSYSVSVSLSMCFHRLSSLVHCSASCSTISRTPRCGTLLSLVFDCVCASALILVQRLIICNARFGMMWCVAPTCLAHGSHC